VSLDEKASLVLPRIHKALIVFPDNHMINGTKLLNVAGMTRGRRDGILKSEKMKHVVKIGPMHLKGVWYIPTYLDPTFLNPSLTIYK
jgi:protein SOK2